MCKLSDYPQLYAKVEGLLREENISKGVPGYEFLKRAIVIYKVESGISEENLWKEVKNGVVIPSNESLSKDRDEVEQWMIEAIKSQSIDLSLMEFIAEIAGKL